LKTRNYRIPDSIAAKTNKTKNLDKLALALTKTLTDTSDKYRVIFTWVALNIEYDCKAFKNPVKREINPEDVISKGRAVCSGYAELFKALCDKAGLETKVISGWTKNSPARIGKEFSKETDHAWNVVRINGKWYHCDVTWAAGSVEGDCSDFIKEFKDYYFCTPPKQFFLNHFPENADWFLGYKISKSDFQEQPHFYSPFFEKDITDLQPLSGTLTFKRGFTVKFRFKTTKLIKNIAVKVSSEKNVPTLPFKKENGYITFEYELKKFSQYLIVFIDNQSAIQYRLKQ
jgi:transglutaminase/protease-like cytokinesis protein 3